MPRNKHQTNARTKRNKGPLVSVIIPTYNHALFLKDAVLSVLQQTYDNFEIFIVDDGSKDDTKEIVARFKNQVNYIRQENKGLSGARNTGIKAARGDFIALLDSDDTWLPEFLSTVVARLAGDPNLGAVHSGFFFIDGHGQLLQQYGISTVADDQMYDRLLDGEFFIPSAVLVRRDCFERVGLFDEALRASEDWDMWLRVAREFRFAGVSQPLTKYRMHGKNMSADPEYMLQYQLMVVNKHFGSADGEPEHWPLERQRSYAAVYRYAAQGFYLRGDKQHGQYYLRLSLEANPKLTESLDLFYELGCADQPLGWRGELAQLNFEKNAALLLSSLDSIFTKSNLPNRLHTQRHTAYGHAYFALGLLAYGSGRFGTARKYLCKAIITEPRLVHRRQIWLTLGKSMLGQRLLETLKLRLKRPEKYVSFGGNNVF